ncbi:MAG: prepilin-type N-terminal cleavage/methylation domain-containing protein [Planctomycetota bacterium]
MLHPARRGSGFSLIEMVVSLAVVSVLLVGMTSAVVLASRSLPSSESTAAATVETARGLHRLRDDLRAAVEIPVFSETSVTLHLPDRDGDGHPEVVTYAWAGTPGSFNVAANPAPLTRAENGNAAVVLIDQIQDFNLDYIGGTRDAVFPGPLSESAEVLLSSFDHNEVSDPSDNDLEHNNPFAAQITPDLPAGVDQYMVTRVLLYSRAHGHANSDYSVQIRPMNGDEPADTATESVIMQESDLTASYEWVETIFSNAGPFGSGEDFAIVLEHESANSAGQFYYDNTATKNVIRSSNGGDTWIYSNSDRLTHYAYGTYETVSDDWTYTTQHVTDINVTVVHATDPATTHRLNVLLPNAPQAEGKLWLADFNADPTTLDGDHDGAADWQTNSGFDTADLDGGRWEATDAMRSAPDGVALDEPFAVDLWAQDTADNGDGGGVRVRFDRDGNWQAYVAAEVNLDASGQNVYVFTKDSGGAFVEWVHQVQPAGEAVNIRLHVDPANDIVGVSIDGEVAGSFTYERLSNASNQDTFRPFVDGTNSGVFIDHLRLAQGGIVAVTPGAYTASSGSSGTSGTSGSSGSSGSNGTSGTSGTSGVDSGSGSTESSSSGGNWWDWLF